MSGKSRLLLVWSVLEAYKRLKCSELYCISQKQWLHLSRRIYEIHFWTKWNVNKKSVSLLYYVQVFAKMQCHRRPSGVSHLGNLKHCCCCDVLRHWPAYWQIYKGKEMLNGRGEDSLVSWVVSYFISDISHVCVMIPVIRDNIHHPLFAGPLSS